MVAFFSPMSFQLSSDAIRWARTDNGISKAVLVALADIAGNDGACFPSIDLIARRVEFSRKSVMRAMVELEARGHLTAVRSRRGNRYVVHPVLNRSESPPQGHQKLEEETPVVPSRDISSPQQGLHKSPTGTSVVPHRDTKQSVSNQEANTGSNHSASAPPIASARADAGNADSPFPIEPPQPKPKREPKPKPETSADPRKAHIMAKLKAVYLDAMGSDLAMEPSGYARTQRELDKLLPIIPNADKDEILNQWHAALSAARHDKYASAKVHESALPFLYFSPSRFSVINSLVTSSIARSNP